MSKRRQANNKTQHGNEQKLEQKLDASFRLKKIVPMTETQEDVFDCWYANAHLFLYGSAGTGKTFVSLYLALKEVLNPNTPYHKVYIVRSAVPSRDQGFLPGKLSEKLHAFESPYMRMLNDLFGRGDAYQIATQKGVVEFISTSYLRGTTFDNCCMVIDETQNLNFEEAKTVITRAGKDCRLVFCGDVNQNDLYRNKFDKSGMGDFARILERMESFEMIEFLPEDIVRSGVCKEFILAELAVKSDVPTA